MTKNWFQTQLLRVRSRVGLECPRDPAQAGTGAARRPMQPQPPSQANRSLTRLHMFVIQPGLLVYWLQVLRLGMAKWPMSWLGKMR